LREPSRAIVFAGTIFAIALDLLGFSYIYSTLWNNVGKFPAESFAVSRADARSVRALCFDSKNLSRNIATSPHFPKGPRAIAIPIRRKPDSAGQLGQLGPSSSLFYSAGNQTIYAIDDLDEADVTHLDDLTFWGIVDAKDVARVLSEPSFAPTCTAPVSDEGITEAYWATKGTFVLHHWAYLYDAAVSDRKPVHAQYGYFVSRLSHRIQVALDALGPTPFVRVAWVMYWFLGICYCVAFLIVFRSSLPIAAIGLAWQIGLFASIGAFTIVLAPGYHWTRELVMILPPLLFSCNGISQYRNPRTYARITILGLVAIALGYLLDPSVAIVATACSALAILATYWRAIGRAIGARLPLAIAFGFAALATIVGVLIVDASNLAYIVSHTMGFAASAFADPARNRILVLNVFVALVGIVLCVCRKAPITAAYFAFISIVTYEFYIITPDSFHFAKYVEYTVPLYVLLASLLLAYLPRFVPPARWRSLETAGAVVFTVYILATPLAALSQLPETWQLRMVDSVGIPYFKSTPLTINNRLIDANLNSETVTRLRAFPVNIASDFIVSPLDKYLLMLYDQHNGYPSVDATAWLDNDTAILTMEGAIASRHKTALIDSEILAVNPLAADLSSNPTIGSANSQSVLNVKSRIRMNELASYLFDHCSVTPADSRRLWYVARC